MWVLILFEFVSLVVQFRNKRIMAGFPFDVHKAETSQQQPTSAPQLDLQRAESSRQHVRALNTQFARSLFYIYTFVFLSVAFNWFFLLSSILVMVLSN